MRALASHQQGMGQLAHALQVAPLQPVCDKYQVRAGLRRFYCEEALEIVNYKLSPLPQYFIREPGSISSYKDYIVTLPTQDRCAGSIFCLYSFSVKWVHKHLAMVSALLQLCYCLPF
jgi:hypothetical protein